MFIVDDASPMKPSSGDDARRPSAGFDEWRALQRATDPMRADIIADIVGHPSGAISVEELAYMNPDRSEDSIRRHLHTLMEVGVVEEHALEPGERMRDFPYKIYALSEDARALFDRNQLFPVDAWQRQYQSVKKTSRIRAVESMPRPD